MTGWARSVRALMFYAAMVVAPLIALLLLSTTSDDEMEGITVNPVPVVVQPTPREIAESQRVRLALSWARGRELHAPGWTGVVTATYVEAGQELRTGDRLLAVDGVDRIAYGGDLPFYRPLRFGDTGPDVAVLHELLIATGHLGAIEFTPGTLAHATGQPFISEAPRIGLASITPDTPNRVLVLRPGVDYVLLVGDEPIPFDRATLTVNEEGLALLADQVQASAENAEGVVRRTEVLDALAVPATAIQANAAGDLCVWVVDEGNGYRAVTVVLGDSRAGVTSVLEGLERDADVLANPAEVLADPGCP